MITDAGTVTVLQRSPGGELLHGQTVVLGGRGQAVRALERRLQAGGAQVVAEHDVAGVLRQVALLGPDAAVVLQVDAATPQLVTALPTLAAQRALVLLTRCVDDRTVLLQAGADHVIDPSAEAPGCSPGELALACLTAVLRRRAAPPPRPPALQAGGLLLDPWTRLASSAGQALPLTVLEFDLLAYFMTNAGRALSRRQLLAGVWGYDVGSLDTVTVHVRRLRTKIEPDPSRPVLVSTVWGVGYRFEVQPSLTIP